MTVSVVSWGATKTLEYQPKPYSKTNASCAKDEITYDFVDDQQVVFDAGVKSRGVSIRNSTELLSQRMRQSQDAKKYIVSLLQEVTEEARLIPFKNLTEDAENKAKANLAFQKSASKDAKVLCNDLIKTLLRHYEPIIKHSKQTETAIKTTLLDLLTKKAPNAITELSRIAPAYIQHLDYKRQMPTVFAQLEDFAQSFKTIDGDILGELRDAIIKGDHEFFIAYHDEISILDDLRAFIARIPNKIYESIFEELLFAIDSALPQTK